MSVNKYIDSVRVALQRLEDYGLVEAINKSQLYIREYVTSVTSKHGLNRVSYAYQYQSEDASLIFRYDNAKHKPALGFDEHKHTRDGTIIQSQLPMIDEIVDEAIENLT